MGDFLPESNLIIQLFITLHNISSIENLFARWIAYINVHVLIPKKHFEVLLDILENLVKPITSGQLSVEKVYYIHAIAKNIAILMY